MLAYGMRKEGEEGKFFRISKHTKIHVFILEILYKVYDKLAVSFLLTQIPFVGNPT